MVNKKLESEGRLKQLMDKFKFHPNAEWLIVEISELRLLAKWFNTIKDYRREKTALNLITRIFKRYDKQ